MGWTLFSGEPHKTKVGRILRRLATEKLLKKAKRGGWTITKEGKEAMDHEG